MKMILFLVFPTLVLLSFSLPGERLPSPADRDETGVILDRYLEACGGEKLARRSSEARKGTLMRGTCGQVPFVLQAKVPGMWRFDQTFVWGDRVSFGCDGTQGWVADTKGISTMDARQRMDLDLILDPQAPLKLRSLYPELSLKGSEKIEGQTTDVLTAVSLEGFVTELAFDRDSGLLVRAGKIFFEDYRDVEGTQRPFRIRLGSREEADYFQMILEITETRTNLEIDDTLFRKPQCFLSMGEPLFLEPEQQEVEMEALEACVGVYRHPKDENVTFTVTRQGNHLMFARTGFGPGIEIKPYSETDYFIGFLQQTFHFIKDAEGRVVRLEMGADRSFKAERVSTRSQD
ncbi:MAG: hypothetical protein ABIK28_15420 [Planctomycetota bacterium]